MLTTKHVLLELFYDIILQAYPGGNLHCKDNQKTMNDTGGIYASATE